MAKTTSKRTKIAAKPSAPKSAVSPHSAPKTRKKAPKFAKLRKWWHKTHIYKLGLKIAAPIKKFIARIKKYRSERVILHHSFRRSYREDYRRETKTPGLLTHAATTFRLIFRHWKTFLPFLALMMLLYVALVGLMSEDFYKQFQDSIDQTSIELASGNISNLAKAGLLLLSTVTTGGLDSGMSESEMMFMIALFLIIWLVTIFLARHYLKGSKPRLRDALYNSLTPLLSTLVVFVIAFIQAIPLMLVAITYNAAVVTGFLSTPFYALVYFIFAAVMILLSLYMLSSSLMALVAVSAPGVYPIVALSTASDLMAGRRTRLVLRLIYLVFVVAIIYIVVMLPVILLDLWFKSMWEWIAGWPIVPFMLLLTTCFVFIYVTVYLYKYYRWLLEYQEK